jgi:hypothetical protein
MKRQVKDGLKRMLAGGFHLGQRIGFDLLPRHFYSEVPFVHRLKQTRHWRQPFSMIDVPGAAIDPQVAFVRSTLHGMPETAQRMASVYGHACEVNGSVGFGPIEAQFLYAFVATHRPSKIHQIGCGVSTAICLQAARDAGYHADVVCIDPFPTDYLQQQHADGQIRLIVEPVELVDVERLVDMAAGDLFFVDSSHTLGPAGEVSRLILEVLPRLPDDVFAHFHDIWYPYDYSPSIFEQLFFWHESVLLHAFLVANSRFRIVASLSMIHHAKQRALQELFPDYQPCNSSDGIQTAPGDYPSSIYLKASTAA